MTDQVTPELEVERLKAVLSDIAQLDCSFRPAETLLEVIGLAQAALLGKEREYYSRLAETAFEQGDMHACNLQTRITRRSRHEEAR
jgi:hypothetical protein